MTATPCSICDFVHTDTRKLSPFKWRCVKKPQELAPPIGLELVAPEWRPDPPYALCMNRRDFNTPECPDFAVRRLPRELTE